MHHLEGHPEGALRLDAVHRALVKSGLWSKANTRKLTEISEEILRLGHTPEYIRHVRDTCRQQAPGYLRHEKWSSYFGPHTYEVAGRAATGLATFCVDVADGRASRGFALLRPPGHHAGASQDDGFCIFNNVALAALHLLRKGPASRKVAIVDLDAHHGNGIQEITGANPRVLYISTHQKDWFPYLGNIEETGLGEGKGTVVNVPLPRHTGDVGYAQIWERITRPTLLRFKPDFLLVCAGYDAHWLDPMAELGLSLRGYHHLHQELIRFADEFCGGKIVFSLEGGYQLAALSSGVVNTVSLLHGSDQFLDPVGNSPYKEPEISELVEKVRKIHSLS